jgi:hypothetical protein
MHPVNCRSTPNQGTVSDDEELVDSVTRRVRREELDGLPQRARVKAPRLERGLHPVRLGDGWRGADAADPPDAE